MNLSVEESIPAITVFAQGMAASAEDSATDFLLTGVYTLGFVRADAGRLKKRRRHKLPRRTFS